MKLADGREFDPAHPYQWGQGGFVLRFNIYDCPGDGPETHIDHSGSEPRIVDAVAVHGLLSADLDEGVTPFMVTCPEHQKTATSRFYRVSLGDVKAYLPVRMVWRKATKGEQEREKREGGSHYAQGGLAREWVTDPPVSLGLGGAHG